MTWPVVARRDLRELLAEKTLYYFCALFALVGGGVASIAARGQAPTRLSHLVALLFLFATPPLAVTFVQQAIPRSVTTGRIRLTLSLPHSRAAFVAGVGAAAVVAALAVTAAGVLGAVAMYLVRGAPVDLLGLVPVLALLVLLAAAFVGALPRDGLVLQDRRRIHKPLLTEVRSEGLGLVLIFDEGVVDRLPHFVRE